MAMYYYFAAFLYLFLQLGTVTAAAYSPCLPHFPTVIPPSGERNMPMGIGGDWYMYRQKSEIGGATGTINQRIRWITVANTVDTLTNIPAVALWVQFAQYDIPENKTCQNHLWSGLYTEDGRVVGTVTVTEDNFVMRRGTFAIQYHNYNKVIIAYACFGKNPDGTCFVPVIIVMTRVEPRQLSAQDKTDFDNIFETVFAPYCVTTAEAPIQPYTDSLPFCPFIDAPDCFAKNLAGLAYLKAAGKRPMTKASYYGLPSCRLPNSIMTQVAYDPKQAGGDWYGYRFSSIDAGLANRLRYRWHNIGTGTLPLSSITAQLQWMEYAFETGAANACKWGHYAGEVGTNGQSDGLLGPLSETGPRLILKLNTLHFDNAFALHYGCIVPDPMSSYCRTPFVLAGVRQDAAQLSMTDKASYDSIITSFFGKYGCTANDIWEVTQFPGIDCGYRNSSCVDLNIQGLREAVEGAIASESTLLT